jgi:hypothetical protein
MQAHEKSLSIDSIKKAILFKKDGFGFCDYLGRASTKKLQLIESLPWLLVF